jgi:hypothetical protein
MLTHIFAYVGPPTVFLSQDSKIVTSIYNFFSKELTARVEKDMAERDEFERVKREEKRIRVAKMKAERKAKQDAEEAAELAAGKPVDDGPKLNVWSTEPEPASEPVAVAVAGESDTGSTPSSPGEPIVPPGMVAPESPASVLPPLRGATGIPSRQP